MQNSWLIAMRELKERVKNRSFVVMAVFGPILVLLTSFLLFEYGGEGKQKWNVLIADPGGIMQNKLMAGESKNVSYSFADNYVELDEFRDGKRFQQFDALVEVNEKILVNKTMYVFYRTKPSVNMQTSLQLTIERRLEEVLALQFSKLSMRELRKIKQPLTVGFRDVYDPYNKSADLSGWAGFFFGAVILLFIALFGISILRSISSEKSNRIVEVLLAAVRPNELLLGKITGIGLAAFIQFVIWIVFIGGGLYLIRLFYFQDLVDPANFQDLQMTQEVKNQTLQEQMLAWSNYNGFVELIYERMQFGVMLFYFFLFFIAGYLFYGAFFAAIGSTSGSENDGQQFVLPIVFLLIMAFFSGYYTIQYPESTLAVFFHYLPFTSPMVVMVRLAAGYPEGHAYELYLSLFVLLLAAFFMLKLAGRLYKNGILQFGHRIRFSTLIQWMKKS